MEFSRESPESLEKDIADLEKLLTLAERDYSKALLTREISVLKSKKELVRVISS